MQEPVKFDLAAPVLVFNGVGAGAGDDAAASAVRQHVEHRIRHLDLVSVELAVVLCRLLTAHSLHVVGVLVGRALVRRQAPGGGHRRGLGISRARRGIGRQGFARLLALHANGADHAAPALAGHIDQRRLDASRAHLLRALTHRRNVRLGAGGEGLRWRRGRTASRDAHARNRAAGQPADNTRSGLAAGAGSSLTRHLTRRFRRDGGGEHVHRALGRSARSQGVRDILADGPQVLFFLGLRLGRPTLRSLGEPGERVARHPRRQLALQDIRGDGGILEHGEAARERVRGHDHIGEASDTLGHAAAEHLGFVGEGALRLRARRVVFLRASDRGRLVPRLDLDDRAVRRLDFEDGHYGTIFQPAPSVFGPGAGRFSEACFCRQ
ncbi:hypothetical protein [Phenylobacterium sp. J367]|uniref:hypothetical protein n=1 Tax=Phenylobacterium sp. J367 TaxID=2898435 RepID=UPI0021515563|nr:hypothetical protein [Phenylobacterium sp. J367]MCR5881190.1 hypothetical protein [Phenylobacterium sp. J367]